MKLLAQPQPDLIVTDVPMPRADSVESHIKLSDALIAGKPGRYYAAGSRGAQDFSDLAASLIPLLEPVV